METNRKKVGFIDYEVNTSENNASLPATSEQTAESTKFNIPISQAQADLIKDINNLISMAIDKSFAQYSDIQRVNIIKTLVTSVALNSELSTKTNLLMA